MAGLLLLPGRLLGPDRPVAVALPLPQKAVSVQAAPPLTIRHLVKPKPKTLARATVTPRRYAYVARPAATVVRVSPGRKLLKAHRSAVIRRLAPTAPLVRARVLATAARTRPLTKPATSSAQTIAALAASLSKK